jgi:hypothetical protein
MEESFSSETAARFADLAVSAAMVYRLSQDEQTEAA